MRRTGVAALVLASLFWGTTGTTASFLPADVSPLAVGASTMGVGGALLLLVRLRPAVGVLLDPAALRWALLGGLGVLIYPLAFYTGMSWAGVAVGNVVALGSGPAFAALLEWIFERRRLSVHWAASAGIAVVGIALLAVGRVPAEGSARGDVVAGVLLSLLAGAAYALYSYASSRTIRAGHPSSGAMGAVFGVGAVLLLPVLLVTGAPLLQSPLTVTIASYLALGPTFVAYLLFGIGLRSIPSSVATTITLLEPVVTTVLAVTVVHEVLAPIGWAGLALVLAGLLVLIPARRRTAAGPAL